MPASDVKTSGIQLWINFPKRLKQIEPAYQALEADQVPEQAIKGGLVRHIVSIHSPLKLKTDVMYLDIQLQAAARHEVALTTGLRGIIYMVSGVAHVLGKKIVSGQACLFDQIELVDIQVDTDVRLMLAAGAPHGEPIKQHGPFVD